MKTLNRLKAALGALLRRALSDAPSYVGAGVDAVCAMSGRGGGCEFSRDAVASAVSESGLLREMDRKLDELLDRSKRRRARTA